MSMRSAGTWKQERLNEEKKEGATKYEYAGRQIRIHFTGGETFAQCMKNLAGRGIR